MTGSEAAARDEIAGRFGAPAVERLGRFAEMVRQENEHQNLIAPSTLDHIWVRHLLDSTQLLFHVEQPVAGPWVDIGSGAGFPGIVIGMLQPGPVVLVEPRKRRAAFLSDAVTTLGLQNVSVHAGRIESLSLASPAAVISARAVAALPALFAMATHIAGPDTRWILPKGRSARDEVAQARQAWHGRIETAESCTDAESLIILASGVRKK